MDGIIIPGIGVRRKNLDVAEDDDALEFSDEEDGNRFFSNKKRRPKLSKLFETNRFHPV